MKRQLLAMASSVALGLAISSSGPAGAIQLTPDLGSATDANVMQVKDREGGGSGFSGRSGGGGGGPSVSIRSGRDSGGISRGNFSAPRGNFQARGEFKQGGDIRARGQVQTREIQKKEFSRDGDLRARGQVQTREIQKKEFSRDLQVKRDDGRHADYSRWKGNRPHIVHRGWDRHHKHRFFGAFLIGVPFGYAAVSTHPCYDWIYGPQGWGYYWNYDRCPV